MGSIERRLERLEELAGASGREEAAEREEKRKKVREQAEHANYCSDRPRPTFVIDDTGNVFSSRDGKPITEPRQTLAEEWYWEKVEVWEGEDLVHDAEAEAFYTLDGELALSREQLDLRLLMGRLTRIVEEERRAYVAQSKQGDRELLERNRASVGLPPLTPEQVDTGVGR